MHISSLLVNPKTRFAGTQRPVPIPVQSASVAQLRGVPSRASRRANVFQSGTPGVTPGSSSQPSFIGVVTPLSCVQV